MILTFLPCISRGGLTGKCLNGSDSFIYPDVFIDNPPSVRLCARHGEDNGDQDRLGLYSLGACILGGGADIGKLANR